MPKDEPVVRERADSSDLIPGMEGVLPPWSPPPIFNTLKGELLSNNSSSFVPIKINAREATPFETEFFKGTAMLILRTDPVDPYFQSFFNGKRLFEVQVQGQFKRLPEGEIYVGAEVSNKVELGIITKSIARGAMKFCETLVANLHTSFGDYPDQPNYEMPHMVSPLFTTFDKVVVSKPGETPPLIGIPFPETPEERKHRRQWKKIADANIDISNIYSFSVNTSQVSLTEWKLVGIPMIKPIDLSTFFGTSQIRLVGYEIPQRELAQFPHTQPHERLNYVFNLKLTRLESTTGRLVDLPEIGNHPEELNGVSGSSGSVAGTGAVGGPLLVGSGGGSVGDVDSGEDKPVFDPSNLPGATPLPIDLQSVDSGEGVEEAEHLLSDDELDSPDDDDALLGEAEYGSGGDYGSGTTSAGGGAADGAGVRDSPSRRRLWARRKKDGGGAAADGSGAGMGPGQRKSVSRAVGGWFRRKLGGGGPGAAGGSGSGGHMTGDSGAVLTGDDVGGDEDFIESTDFHMTDYAMESHGDLRYCPGSVEVNDYRREGRRRVLYFLPTPFSEITEQSAGAAAAAVAFASATLGAAATAAEAAAGSSSDTGSSPRSQQHLEPQPQPQDGNNPDRRHSADQSGTGHSSRAISIEEMADRIQVTSTALRESASNLPPLRSYSEIAKVLPLSTIPRMHKNKRLSFVEKRRRQIVEAYKTSLRQPAATAGTLNPMVPKLQKFLCDTTEADASFLAPVDSAAAVELANKLSNNKSNGGATECWEGTVALAMSRRHWSEHHMILNVNEVVFKKRNARGLRALHTIEVANIISVQVCAIEETALQKCSFFQIETFSRMYYIMVYSDLQLNEWMQAFITLLGARITRSPFDGKTLNPAGFANMDDREDFYICKASACWRLGQKRILNYRRIIFTAQGLPGRYRGKTAAQIVEEALETVLYLAQPDSSPPSAAFGPDAGKMTKSRSTAVHWVLFMDLISLFQTFNLSVVPETERVPILMNIYHIMVIHGSLLIGPPPSWNSWNSFFSNIAYLIGYEIISVDELGHNIIRASMSRPSSLSIVSVPHMPFPGVALTHRDFRYNFCINSGSRSMPAVVPIYNSKDLDDQLDEMTSRMISETIEIDTQKKTVVLPKFSLYDFSASRQTYATPLEVLRCVAPYVSKPEHKTALKKLLSDSSNIYIRFKNISFRCRLLRKCEPCLPQSGVDGSSHSRSRTASQEAEGAASW